MPFDAFLVFGMDLSIVLKLCHNSGWPSLPHNKPICYTFGNSHDSKRGLVTSGHLYFVVQSISHAKMDPGCHLDYSTRKVILLAFSL